MRLSGYAHSHTLLTRCVFRDLSLGKYNSFNCVCVQVVGLAKNDIMTHTLVDFLMGENDGVPKDPHYIFHLYMALGNYAQVCVSVSVRLCACACG